MRFGDGETSIWTWLVKASQCMIKDLMSTILDNKRAPFLSIIPTAEGRELAKHFGCRFIETSAKQRINVDEAFYNLVREIRRYNKDQQYAPGRQTLNGPGNGTEFSARDDDSGCCCVIL